MTSYLAIALFIVGLELLRRCCLVLLTAFTGPLSKVPGPFWMKISNLPWNMMQIRGDQLIEGPALLAKYGNIVRITPKAVIVAGTNEIYRIIVQDDFKKGPDYEMINSRPDVTTLFTERDKAVYKQKRRMMSPGFSIAYLNGLEPSMHECVRIFEEKLIGDCVQSGGSAIVDISNILSNLGSDILSETVLGKSLDLVRSNDTKLKNIFMERTERAALYANFPLLKYLPFMPPAVNPEFNKMVEDIVAQRRAVPPEKRKRDLLQIFLDQNEADPVAFSEDNLREEIQLFMVAGSDTTSYTATCSLLLLLNNPTALQTLIQEIDTAFPKKDDFIAFDKTQSLLYLNAVINESMRLMPVAGAGLHRQIEKPTNIHGYELPAGTILQPWVAKPMKDETLFPRPNDFVPERWLGEYQGVQVDRKAFLPFSAGSRSCIGQQYALRELRLIIVTLLRRFELSIVPGQSHEIRIHVVPSLKQGYYSIKIKPRTS